MLGGHWPMMKQWLHGQWLKVSNELLLEKRVTRGIYVNNTSSPLTRAEKYKYTILQYTIVFLASFRTTPKTQDTNTSGHVASSYVQFLYSVSYVSAYTYYTYTNTNTYAYAYVLSSPYTIIFIIYLCINKHALPSFLSPQHLLLVSVVYDMTTCEFLKQKQPLNLYKCKSSIDIVVVVEVEVKVIVIVVCQKSFLTRTVDE